jgi:hypothetical protein
LPEPPVWPKRPKEEIDCHCPVQVGVHTVTVIMHDYWYASGAHPWANGEYAIDGDAYPGVCHLKGKRHGMPVRSWWAHTVSYNYLTSVRGKLVLKNKRWWKITWHAPRIGELMDGKTLIARLCEILTKMRAPEHIIDSARREFSVANVVAVDVARDYARSGIIEPSLDEAREHRRHRMTSIRRVRYPDERDGETMESAPDTLYIQTRTRSLVEIHYEKKRCLRQLYGIHIRKNLSRVELRRKGGQLCKRHGLGTLPEVCNLIAQMRALWREEKRRAKRTYREELVKWRAAILALRRNAKLMRRREKKNLSRTPRKKTHIVYRLTIEDYPRQNQSRSGGNDNWASPPPYVFTIIPRLRGPPYHSSIGN